MGQLTFRQQLREIPLKARNYSTLAALVARVGPVEFARLYKEYPWIPMAGRIHELMDHAMNYRESMGEVIHLLLKYVSNVLQAHVKSPENLVWYEELLTPEIPAAMGFTPFMPESLGLVLPLIESEAAIACVDRTENAGYPADMCSFIKTSLGQILADELPRPRLILTTNSPCDSAMAGYVPIEERLGVPVYRMDQPYETNEKSLAYYAKGLWKMIDFLEQETGRKMDFDRLKEICEERNRASEYILEFRELMQNRPAPLGGLLLTMSIFGSLLLPGTEATTKCSKALRDEAKRRVDRNIGALEDERIRVILWNPPFLIDGGLFQWMEETYGAIIVMDMLAYRSYGMIDISSPESMIRDLAHDMMKGPMARHTRGSAKNYYEDLIRLYREYAADMVLMASHQGCKNALAMSGIIRDLFRKKDIPLLDIQYDLVDPRVTSPEEIRNQVSHFMETVMGDKL